ATSTCTVRWTRLWCTWRRERWTLSTHRPSTTTRTRPTISRRSNTAQADPWKPKRWWKSFSPSKRDLSQRN
ncbi:unnamed protein product, partial [Amoebophrya sp. A120]